MAEFYSAVTTDSGISLAADLFIGEQIVFTKLVTGSGAYQDDDLLRVNLQKATELREPKQEFCFNSVTKETDSCILLKTLLSNVELTEGYRMTEIGVYAKRKGDEGDGILYSLSVAKEADYFPRYNGMAAVEIIEEYYITVSDAAKISIETVKGAVVLLEDFERFKEEMRNKVDALQNRIGNLGDPFIQMTETTYISPAKRSGGSLYGFITGKRRLIIDPLDRYVAGIENPTVERTLYGIESTERTSLEEDESPYVGMMNNIVHIEDGQETERQPEMIYAVNKGTR